MRTFPNGMTEEEEEEEEEELGFCITEEEELCFFRNSNNGFLGHCGIDCSDTLQTRTRSQRQSMPSHLLQPPEMSSAAAAGWPERGAHQPTPANRSRPKLMRSYAINNLDPNINHRNPNINHRDPNLDNLDLQSYSMDFTIANADGVTQRRMSERPESEAARACSEEDNTAVDHTSNGDLLQQPDAMRGCDVHINVCVSPRSGSPWVVSRSSMVESGCPWQFPPVSTNEHGNASGYVAQNVASRSGNGTANVASRSGNGTANVTSRSGKGTANVASKSGNGVSGGKTPCEHIDMSLSNRDSHETQRHEFAWDFVSGPSATNKPPTTHDDSNTMSLHSRYDSAETAFVKPLWESQNGPEAMQHQLPPVPMEDLSASLHSHHMTEFEKLVDDYPNGADAREPACQNAREPVCQDARKPVCQDAREPVCQDETQITITFAENPLEYSRICVSEEEEEDDDDDDAQKTRKFKPWKRKAMRRSGTKSGSRPGESRSPDAPQQVQRTRSSLEARDVRIEHDRLQQCSAGFARLRSLAEKPTEFTTFEVYIKRPDTMTMFGLKFINGSVPDRARWIDDDEYYATKIVPNLSIDGQVRSNDTIERVNGVRVAALSHIEVEQLVCTGLTVKLLLRRYKECVRESIMV